MGKSKLSYYLKEEINGKFILELKIHTVTDTNYSEGVKYSLIMINPKTGEKVLMDNHHPKGPHFHLNADEFDYDYKDEDQLIEDFKKLASQHFGVKL